mmetsp:Transcript_5106/g.4666  ORF Transcript_5106/g.4666 Transcript_5106/m.4666 type:complete len:173 (-) Transcript_5106:1420-1938(-)
MMKGKGNQEADEFSLICEHIEDEPSIHVRTIDQFQNILKRESMNIVMKSGPEPVLYEGPLNTQSSSYYVKQKPPKGHPQYETFESSKQVPPNIPNLIYSQVELDSKDILSSYLGDETLEESSAFFNEHNCSTSLLHRCHLVEKYSIPNKVLKTTQALNPKQLQCNQKINTLI